MDMNVEVSKKAMTVLGRIANKLRSSVDHIVHELLTILDVGNTVIVDTAIVTLKGMLTANNLRTITIITLLRRYLAYLSCICNKRCGGASTCPRENSISRS